MLMLMFLLQSPQPPGLFYQLIDMVKRPNAHDIVYYLVWGGLSISLMTILIFQTNALRRTAKVQATLGVFKELQTPEA